jgi:Tfp pilus assembly ATPase PilU
MPRFFFHIRGADRRLSRDELGLDFPDVETACLEAVRAARDMGGAFALRGQDPHDYAIEVADGSHEFVFNLPFSKVLDH